MTLSKSHLALLPDSHHVLAHAGGHQPSDRAAHPPQDVVSSLVQIVDPDSALGVLSFTSSHLPLEIV